MMKGSITTRRLLARPCWYQLIQAGGEDCLPALVLRMSPEDAEVGSRALREIRGLGLLPHTEDHHGLFVHTGDGDCEHLFSWPANCRMHANFERFTDHALAHGGDIEVIVVSRGGEARHGWRVFSRATVQLRRYPDIESFYPVEAAPLAA